MNFYVYRGRQPYRGPSRRERLDRFREEQEDKATNKCDRCHYKRTGMNHRILCKGLPE